MEFIQIQVEERKEQGKSSVRRMRREGRVPAVLYGLQRRTLSLTIPGTELDRFLKTGSHLVELRMGEQTRPAILREVQMDPLTEEVLHLDFVRVDKDSDIEDHVPIVYKGIAKGTAEGGIFQSQMEFLHVRCRPHLIPKQFVLDITHLGVDDAIYHKDVQLPEGVSLVGEPDELVAHVVPLREEMVAEEAPEEATAEPEVIRKEREGDDDGGPEEKKKKGD